MQRLMISMGFFENAVILRQVNFFLDNTEVMVLKRRCINLRMMEEKYGLLGALERVRNF